MKAKLERLQIGEDKESFLRYMVQVPYFEFQWHYHPEYELTYIVKGKGKRLVGDRYESFEEGDLVLLGPYLPHTWAGQKEEMNKKEELGQKDPLENQRAIVIQFREELFKPIWHYPELQFLNQILGKSNRGLFFQPKDSETICQILKMPEIPGEDAFISLLKILKELSKENAQSLSSEQFKLFKGKENQQRINKVFKYVQDQFQGQITLKDAANLVHLSESAFCKFFKRASGKTFSDYVNDVRIARACELLIETDTPIDRIFYETGFESQTYFNRVFKKKKGIQPYQYRKR